MKVEVHHFGSLAEEEATFAIYEDGVGDVKE